jgi:hypothetical protein
MLTVIGAIANLASILGIVGLFVAWRTFRADHERSRREKAIEYILDWVRGLDRRATLARKFVEMFNQHQAKCLFEQKSFHIDRDLAPLMEGVFEQMPEVEDGQFNITQAMSADLRWIIVNYINNLEAIMSAWYYQVADRKMLAEQFSYLISPSLGNFLLPEFRVAANAQEHYPAITAFVMSYKTDRAATLLGKVYSVKAL